MTDYLHRASIARAVKAATISRPPHAGFIGDIPEAHDATPAPPQGVVRAADRIEAMPRAFA